MIDMTETNEPQFNRGGLVEGGPRTVTNTTGLCEYLIYPKISESPEADGEKD